jgi:hypothetical protein
VVAPPPAFAGAGSSVLAGVKPPRDVSLGERFAANFAGGPCAGANEAVASDKWPSLPGAAKDYAICNLIEDGRKAAEPQFLRQHPEVLKAAMAKRQVELLR